MRSERKLGGWHWSVLGWQGLVAHSGLCLHLIILAEASWSKRLHMQVGYDSSLVLFFDCPEDVLERRLLSRNQVGPGRGCLDVVGWEQGMGGEGAAST